MRSCGTMLPLIPFQIEDGLWTTPSDVPRSVSFKNDIQASSCLFSKPSQTHFKDEKLTSSWQHLLVFCNTQRADRTQKSSFAFLTGTELHLHRTGFTAATTHSLAIHTPHTYGPPVVTVTLQAPANLPRRTRVRIWTRNHIRPGRSPHPIQVMPPAQGRAGP